MASYLGGTNAHTHEITPDSTPIELCVNPSCQTLFRFHWLSWGKARLCSYWRFRNFNPDSSIHVPLVDSELCSLNVALVQAMLHETEIWLASYQVAHHMKVRPCFCLGCRILLDTSISCLQQWYRALMPASDRSTLSRDCKGERMIQIDVSTLVSSRHYERRSDL